MNKVFKNNWHWFLIGVVITSVIVSIGISIRCSPTAKEKILYYICSSKVNVSALVEENNKVVDQSIREIRVNHESLKESNYSRLFGMVYDSTDIYIYPEEQLERTVPLSAHFSESDINKLIPNSIGKELYLDGDEYCAIKIYDYQTEQGLLKELIDYQIPEGDQQNYYLSFYKSSLHIKGLNNSNSDNALKIVNHLLEL